MHFMFNTTLLFYFTPHVVAPTVLVIHCKRTKKSLSLKNKTGSCGFQNNYVKNTVNMITNK